MKINLSLSFYQLDLVTPKPYLPLDFCIRLAKNPLF